MGCDDVYTERNRLVAALTKFFPSVIIKRSGEPEGWQHIVYIHGPEGQMSWHIGDDDLHLFSLPIYDEPDFEPWDGHTTEEKYERLSRIKSPAEEMKTILTDKETGAILYAIRSALAKEDARIAYFGADEKVAFGSELRLRLMHAEGILENRRERAEEMGG